MTRRSNKQRHLDRAEIIGNYGDAFKKWRWMLVPVAVWFANSESIQAMIRYIFKAISP